MKKFIISSILVALLSAGLALKAQSREEYLGLPGDNLNLYAVMQLFQNSKTLEEFERNLNDPNSNINNLDLNGDNMVDYIKVFDEVDGNVHNIVLQVPVSRRENQDVAVFTVQRFNNGQVMVQLTGDEALYGRNYIIQPIADETPNPGYNGTYERTTTTQIAFWPIVRYVYLPTYVVWRSNWYWGYYPTYWNPWRTYSWHYYYGYHYHWNDYYYGHYQHADQHYYTRYDDYYYRNHRSYSSEVKHNIKKGTYQTTYSHPEQRREGEALFATKYPERYKSSSANSSGNSRRSDNNASNNRSSDNPKSFSNSGNSRRQNNIDLNKSSDRSFSNSGNARRSGGNNSQVKQQNGASNQQTRENANVTNSQQQRSSNQVVKSERRQSSNQNAHSSKTQTNSTSASPSSGRTKSESSSNKETRRSKESKEKASTDSERRQ